VPFLDGADLNSSKKSLLQKTCSFTPKFIVILTRGLKKTLGLIVIAVMKEIKSSQRKQIYLSSYIRHQSSACLRTIWCWKSYARDPLTLSPPAVKTQWLFQCQAFQHLVRSSHTLVNWTFDLLNQFSISSAYFWKHWMLFASVCNINTLGQ
jgi:hypothetical protein